MTFNEHVPRPFKISQPKRTPNRFAGFESRKFDSWLPRQDSLYLTRWLFQDLHRTGCSLFCGAAGRDNQAVLRRVLLGFARWNKSVGYCQGLNVLAALILQVMDRAESAAVKVMIYLIEGVLPEGYFADNLRGLSVDMAVFRDLLRSRLPRLSKHLEALQTDAKDKATGFPLVISTIVRCVYSLVGWQEVGEV